MVEFKTNRIPEMLIEKLTKAELEIYLEIKKKSDAENNSETFATIDYLINHSTYNSRSFISKILKRLTDKGLLVRELMQSNKSIHKCYQYYVVQDLRLTSLYQSLTDEEIKKYTHSENS